MRRCVVWGVGAAVVCWCLCGLVLVSFSYQFLTVGVPLFVNGMSLSSATTATAVSLTGLGAKRDASWLNGGAIMTKWLYGGEVARLVCF